MLLVSLPLCFWVLWGVRDTNYDVEHVTKVEDVSDGVIEGLALPPGHHAGGQHADLVKNPEPEVA